MKTNHKELEEQIEFNLNNKYNCIPIGFKRYAEFYPGIIKGTHTCITGSKDSGTSEFFRFHWVLNALDFVKKVNNVEQLDIKIFIYLLKQSKKAFRAEILCSLLYIDHKIELNYLDLLSIQEENNRKMSKEILELVRSYDEWFKFFDSKVEVYSDKKKPTEIYDTTRKWIEEYAAKPDYEGESRTWKYNNPNLFIVNCTDQVNSLASEIDKGTGTGMDIKRCIEKHVITNMTNLKNIYDVAVIDLQDQALDRERVEYNYNNQSNFEKLEPGIDGLGESKVVSRYYDFIIGIFAPANYDMLDHRGYNIALLQDNYRSIKLLSTIFGKRNKYIGMWYNNSARTFEEMPRVEELKTQLQLENYINKRRK